MDAYGIDVSAYEHLVSKQKGTLDCVFASFATALKLVHPNTAITAEMLEQRFASAFPHVRGGGFEVRQLVPEEDGITNAEVLQSAPPITDVSRDCYVAQLAAATQAGHVVIVSFRVSGGYHMITLVRGATDVVQAPLGGTGFAWLAWDTARGWKILTANDLRNGFTFETVIGWDGRPIIASRFEPHELLHALVVKRLN